MTDTTTTPAESWRAIPTRYKSTTFRSRLEARWAIFFDASKCPYLYEPRSFDLGAAGLYVPDFYLTDFHTFYEVKPSPVTATKKHLAFVEKIHSLTFLIGPPAFCGYPNLYSHNGRSGITSVSVDFHGSYKDEEFPDPFDELNPDHLANFSPEYQEAVRAARFHHFSEAN